MLDMEWWRRQPPAHWDQVLNAEGIESDSSRQKSRTSGWPHFPQFRLSPFFALFSLFLFFFPVGA
jgi:hypothetical protein